MNNTVVVRGGGDIGTGVIYALKASGYRVFCLESEKPSAIRRRVALSEAIYEGEYLVEDLKGVFCESLAYAYTVSNQNNIPILIDPKASLIKEIKPFCVVDAILAKVNLGTTRDMADITIALGPGFCGGVDVDAVIETMRGHNLGRIITDGYTLPNTKIPGVVGGESEKRVIHSSHEGIINNIRDISDFVKCGEVIANITTKDGLIIPVKATISGLLRGIIRDGYYVTKGFKIADIDPREGEYKNCFTISDKSRCIGGSVAMAIGRLKGERLKKAEGVYLDNSATTLKKPYLVKEALIEALEGVGNEGRGFNSVSLDTSRRIYSVRESISDFFDGYGGENVVFTANGTESLNIAINGIINEGETAITTVMDHNSVLRPLYRLEREREVKLKIIGLNKDYSLNLDSLAKEIEKKPKALVITHSSNLTGDVNDISLIGRLCRENNVIFIVDSAQTGGILPISMKNDNIDVLCFTGHKALYGIQGTGGMVINPKIKIKPLKVGGSGIKTFDKLHPQNMPNLLEAGTLNGHGIYALGAGVEFIKSVGRENIKAHIDCLSKAFLEGVSNIKGIKIYGQNNGNRVGIIALNLEGIDSNSLGYRLSSEYGISVRSGGHCAPLIHKALGTEELGIVRFSFSYFTTLDEISYAIKCLKEIAYEGI